MTTRDTPADAGSPVPAREAEALKTGRPPPRAADDGKAGGQTQGGKPGRSNDPGEGGERGAPGDASRGG